LAPAAITEFAVATKVKEGSITSSPGLTPIDNKDAWSAEVPELTAITCFTLTYSRKLLSNS
jgi:hypothetical protein